MADKEHLKIFGQGVEKWNRWRQEQPETFPDLAGADLRGAHLQGADLQGARLLEARLNSANLFMANLIGANLCRAVLSGAHLPGAQLRSADLSIAELRGVNLRNADLTDANLNRADLTNAYLVDTNLCRADLGGAQLLDAILQSTDLSSANLISANLNHANLNAVDFHKAAISRTSFVDIDLREVHNLETLTHRGPSGISTSTIYRSEGKIPEAFLRGCGLRDWEIEATRLYRTDLSRDQVVDITYKVIELRSDPLIQFNSCFISYSSDDDKFTRHLYSDLQSTGVRCWFAPEDMKIGDRIRHRIDDSIRLHDKLLLVLSESSVSSQWIEQEVETALEKERDQGCNVLFPIRLDDTVMEARSGWPALIKKTRHIGDFSHWNNPNEYKKVFKRLLADLRVEV